MKDAERRRIIMEAIDALNAATDALHEESRRYAGPDEGPGPMDQPARDRLRLLESEREAAKARYLSTVAAVRRQLAP